MTVKKRLFISNTAIVLLSLVMLMLVMPASFKIAEETFLSRFDDFRQITVTDRNGETVIIERGQSDEQEKAAARNDIYNIQPDCLCCRRHYYCRSAAPFMFSLSLFYDKSR